MTCPRCEIQMIDFGRNLVCPECGYNEPLRKALSHWNQADRFLDEFVQDAEPPRPIRRKAAPSK